DLRRLRPFPTRRSSDLAEALWRARVSPWRPLRDLSDEELRDVLEWAAKLMRASVETGREERQIYRKVGRPCPRCGAPIRSHGQGDRKSTRLNSSHRTTP